MGLEALVCRRYLGAGCCVWIGWKLRRIPASEWSARAHLGAVKWFYWWCGSRTWGWSVPTSIDTEQHTMIVQYLIDHHGLFQSWAPYSDDKTFTYHFGFHAITALFASLSRLDAPTSVLIMSRVMGATAAASLFALVRL